MIKRYVFLLIVCLPFQSVAQENSNADTLHDAFLIRPISIVKEQSRWNITSTDLFTYRISNGLYGLYGSQPQIMLDGIPINAALFGWQNLNMLPVFVQNINRAESHFAPGIYNQTASGVGVINFKSEPAEKGVTAQAFFYSGNETKDPGPWAYDSLKISPNVDRWGPDTGILLMYKTKSWYTKGIYQSRYHKPLDLAQNLRLHITNSVLGTNTGYVNHPIFIRSRSALVEAGFNFSHWGFSSRFIYSKNEDYLFLQPFGREVPMQAEYRQFAVQSKYQNGNWSAQVRYLLDFNKAKKREEIHRYIFDWEQLVHTFSLSGQYNNSVFSVTPGVILKQYNVTAPGLSDLNDRLITAYLKSAVGISDNLKLYMSGYFDYHLPSDAQSITLKLTSTVQLTDSYSVRPEIYYAESMPFRQYSFAYWVNRGYTFADRLNIFFDDPVRILENEALSAKIDNRFSLGNFSLRVVPQFIKNYRLNIPWQIVEYYEFTNTRPGTFTVTQHSGERFKLLASLGHSYANLFQQSLTIYLQNTIGGSERYRNYFKQIVDTKIKYQFDIAPVRGLRLSFNAVYRSSTQWPEFAAVDGKEYRLPAGIPIGDFTGTFHTTIPSYINAGLSVRKWLFDRHLSLQFGLQNILDREVRYHPIGASLYPKFNFKVSLRY